MPFCVYAPALAYRGASVYIQIAIYAYPDSEHGTSTVHYPADPEAKYTLLKVGNASEAPVEVDEVVAGRGCESFAAAAAGCCRCWHRSYGSAV